MITMVCRKLTSPFIVDSKPSPLCPLSPITDANAQQRLPANTRIFIGNIPNRSPRDQVVEKLRSLFMAFGGQRLFVKLTDHPKNPVVFIQFRRDVFAQEAL
ncbi:hypothetical protein BJX99DRAFT_235119, partial [Aspergillus californicus]